MFRYIICLFLFAVNCEASWLGSTKDTNKTIINTINENGACIKNACLDIAENKKDINKNLHFLGVLDGRTRGLVDNKTEIEREISEVKTQGSYLKKRLKKAEEKIKTLSKSTIALLRTKKLLLSLREKWIINLAKTVS